MVDCRLMYEALVGHGVGFFAGVPDSLLSSFSAYITDHGEEFQHITAANEGAAVALACGYHLATGQIPLVYMQNSGLGNAVNPLLSLADRDVYSIPMLLLIGWRGEPGVRDEPQHVKQGRVQNAMLDAMEIPYRILSAEIADIGAFVAEIVAMAKQESRPVAIVVKKNTFQPYKLAGQVSPCFDMKREEAIEALLESLPDDAIVVSTTGMASREVYEYRARNAQSHSRDFLTVGSMGHASQIALGLALNVQRPVVCLDGDGALLMHMGSLAIIGCATARNFYHVLINNGAHDSVGGQPTVALKIDCASIAKACGYQRVESVSARIELSPALQRLLAANGPSMLEIKVNKGARPDLGRPATSPLENRLALMDSL